MKSYEYREFENGILYEVCIDDDYICDCDCDCCCEAFIPYSVRAIDCQIGQCVDSLHGILTHTPKEALEEYKIHHKPEHLSWMVVSV